MILNFATNHTTLPFHMLELQKEHYTVSTLRLYIIQLEITWWIVIEDNTIQQEK